eukprot:TRINITY_DN20941_c0_g1_i1.p1 TRINITY_DN20941_c0_g1~~TRINITY_DN20941_c0_g1_i1.p1  ORF type:complete len:222 (-),score=30.39 TRINITY_DN20941_c0_g1_i1:23-688(-)
MSKPLDYSKWDRLVAEEEAEGSETRGPVRVQKIEPGSSVTFGGNGDTRINPVSSENKNNNQNTADNALEKMTRNGAKTDRYLWCQTLDSAILYWIVPPGTRARQIAIELHENLLQIYINKMPMITEDLSYQVECSADDIVGCWELIDYPLDEANRRLLQIELRKKIQTVPIKMWWNRIFPSETPISMSDIPDRTVSPSQKKWQEVWDQAHETFRENRRMEK